MHKITPFTWHGESSFVNGSIKTKLYPSNFSSDVVSFSRLLFSTLFQVQVIVHILSFSFVTLFGSYPYFLSVLQLVCPIHINLIVRHTFYSLRCLLLLAQIQNENAPVRGRGSDFVPSRIPAHFEDSACAFVAVNQLPSLKGKQNGITCEIDILLHVLHREI